MRKLETQTFETQDGEVAITLRQLDGIESALLVVELAQKHGPAIGALSKAFNAEGGVKLEAVGEAIAAMSQGLHPKDFEALLLKLTRGAQAQVNGEFVDVDRKLIAQLFTGFPMGTFELFAFGMRANYTDFFSAVAKLIPSKPKTAALKMAQTQKPTQTE